MNVMLWPTQEFYCSLPLINSKLCLAEESISEEAAQLTPPLRAVIGSYKWLVLSFTLAT